MCPNTGLDDGDSSKYNKSETKMYRSLGDGITTGYLDSVDIECSQYIKEVWVKDIE